MCHAPLRLVAYDLDGTMLNDQKQIPAENLAALAAAREKGCILLPATGRPLCMVRGPILQVPGVRYVLTSNGAAIWDMGPDPAAAVHSRRGEFYGTPAGRLPAGAKCLALSPLPAASAARAIAALRPFLPGVIKVFVDGRMAYEPEGFAWENRYGTPAFRHKPGFGILVPSLDQALPAWEGKIEKICTFFGDMEKLNAARRALNALPDIAVVQGAPNNLEVTAPGVDKGLGLQKACQALGVDIGQALALGDSENDLAMLRAAGFAGVVANGIPAAKALATRIAAADNNQCGAGELIRFYL